MNKHFDSSYPSSADLRNKAKRRLPRFAFEYLDGGANEEVNLNRNHSDIQEILLRPSYIHENVNPDLNTSLFGIQYSLPIGIAPIGLQGLIWPNSPMILAESAKTYNIPFVLSTVTTADIEQTSEATDGKFWFQLYYPAKDKLKNDLLNRCETAGCNVLIALADTPSFGIRYKDIKNGLSMPPKMTFSNILQILSHPGWALRTLIHGRPNFQTLAPYMSKNLNLKQLGSFMNETFDGRLSVEKIRTLRDQWKGKLVIKGIVNEEDIEKILPIGIDGIIVSNHGGRQLDAGESSISSMSQLKQKYGDRLTIMMDGGVRSGADLARCISAGADFVFVGRPFMYSVGALGASGGNHAIEMFQMQFRQVMDQLGCSSISELPGCLVRSNI